MAGRPRSASLPFSSSSLIAIVSILFFIRSSPSRCILDPNPSTVRAFRRNPNPSIPPPEYSFVASLEKFLTSTSPSSSRPIDTAPEDGGAAAEVLDRSIWRRESERLMGERLDHWSEMSVVRVYVYEMPAKSTYDLLWLFWKTYRESCVQ